LQQSFFIVCNLEEEEEQQQLLHSTIESSIMVIPYSNLLGNCMLLQLFVADGSVCYEPNIMRGTCSCSNSRTTTSTNQVEQMWTRRHEDLFHNNHIWNHFFCNRSQW
jgi:hypothetical protein